MLTQATQAQSAQLPLEDRRAAKSESAPAAEERGSTICRMVARQAHFWMDDILTARHHSDDFSQTRSEYIARRLRFMDLFFAITVPLWIVIDFLTLSPEHARQIALVRCALSASLLVMVALTFRRPSVRQTHVMLGLSFALPAAFYAASMLIVSHGATEPPLAGYSFMPFVMAALIGLFPVTVLFGVLIEAIVLAAFLGVTAAYGELYTLDTFNKLWVFLMIGGATLWIQAGQLLMLLKLYRESTQDPLTGLINRRVLMKRLSNEMEHNDHEQAPFCILMFDLDRFKRINDNYGHLTGDMVLATMAGILKKGLRAQDIIARFGGEEFVAVLPNISSSDAIKIAERIRQACYDAKVTALTGEPLQLSTSVGVTQYEPGEQIEAALSRVDECLYAAKETGRNRVVHAQSKSG